MTDTGRLLQVRDLRVAGPGPGPGPALLRGVDLDLAPGERLALVGPSGCGKSLTARALLGLLPPGFVWSGEICWRGSTLRDPGSDAWRQVRGHGLGLILQEPLTSLNPVLTAGGHIAEALRVHRGLGRREAHDETLGLLAETSVPDPARVARSFSHQLSGGLRQRVLLAATLACRPTLLIADEPTTALDVSVQKEILILIDRLCRERGMALLFITHDLSLVPLLAERVARMEDGRIVTTCPASAVPLPARPVVSLVPDEIPAPVLVGRGLTVTYPELAAPAVAGVDLELQPGRAIGLLGESGCGKTSLGRALAGHVRRSAGQLTLAGAEFPAADRSAARSQRRRVQLLFQDPGASLDPRQTVGAALAEAAGANGADPAALLAEVGLAAGLVNRYPHQLSGGQRQRVALARCLAPAPSVLIADEPTSALDADTRNQVLELLLGVMARRGLALLLVSHDLEVLQDVCDEIQVMYGGLIVERLPGGEAFAPCHPYTRQLQAAVPSALRGDPALWAPTPLHPVAGPGSMGGGCPRFGKCPLQKAICGKELPPLKMLSAGYWLRCPEAETEGSSHFIDTL